MKNTQAIDLIKSSRGRRLFRLIIAALCFVVLTWLAFNTSFESHQLLKNQAQQNARSLIMQLTKNVVHPLQSDDKVRLKVLLNHLASDSNVLGVALYNESGELLSTSEGYSPLDKINGIADSLPDISKLKSPMVETILDENQQPIGFVSMVYFPEKAMSQSHRHFHELGRVVLIMLLITCILTWQVGRALKRWEVKRQIEKSAQDD